MPPSSDLPFTSPEVTTIEVPVRRPRRSKKLLVDVAPYLIAPVVTAALFVLVVAVMAYPIPAVLTCFLAAALAGPLLDIWRKRHLKARRNEARSRSSMAP